LFFKKKNFFFNLFFPFFPKIFFLILENVFFFYISRPANMLSKMGWQKKGKKRAEKILRSVFVDHYFKWCSPEERNKSVRGSKRSMGLHDIVALFMWIRLGVVKILPSVFPSFTCEHIQTYTITHIYTPTQSYTYMIHIRQHTRILHVHFPFTQLTLLLQRS